MLRLEKFPEVIGFEPEELIALGLELESAYNVLSGAGKEPSESFYKLVQFVKREAEVFNDPRCDHDFECEHCGYGKDSA